MSIISRLVPNVSFVTTTKAIVLIITGEKLGKRSRTENTHLTEKQRQKQKPRKDWLEK